MSSHARPVIVPWGSEGCAFARHKVSANNNAPVNILDDFVNFVHVIFFLRILASSFACIGGPNPASLPLKEARQYKQYRCQMRSGLLLGLCVL
jgi:hypothetical protein